MDKKFAVCTDMGFRGSVIQVLSEVGFAKVKIVGPSEPNYTILIIISGDTEAEIELMKEKIKALSHVVDIQNPTFPGETLKKDDYVLLNDNVYHINQKPKGNAEFIIAVLVCQHTSTAKGTVWIARTDDVELMSPEDVKIHMSDPQWHRK